MDFFLGIDIGTSGIKVMVSDTFGEICVQSNVAYSAHYPFKGAVELDPEIVFNALLQCFGECQDLCDLSKVVAISFSSQGEALIPLRADGTVLFNAICTFDTRNAAIFTEFASQVDAEKLEHLTGMPLHPMFSASKIYWLRQHHPEVLEKTWKLFTFDGFIAYRLGAYPAIDYSMAARTMMFDIHSMRWHDEYVSLAGIGKAQLPEPVPTGTEIGCLKKEFSRFGFSDSVRIYAGTHDQLSCCIGAGIHTPKILMDSLGTTESLVCLGGFDRVAKYVGKKIPAYPFPFTNEYAYMTFLSSSASSLNWLKTKILQSQDKLFYRNFDKYVALRQCPTHIFVIPHFCGAGTPSLDFNATATFHGISLDTDIFELYQGILEGVNFEFYRNLQIMLENGIAIDEIRCIGGGANSDVWLQMKADISNREIIGYGKREAGSLGAVMIAMAGSKAIKDLKDGKNLSVKEGNRFSPKAQGVKAYQEKFEQYLTLVRAYSD